MNDNCMIIYDNVAEKLATWSAVRIGKFFKAYYQAKRDGAKSVSTGDDAIDVLISCLLTSSAKAEKRSRGGQPGNNNAAKCETNKNECETNPLLYNNKESIIEENENNSSSHIRSSILPFPNWMTTEEKRQQLWADVVRNQGDYPIEMLKEFALYYGQDSAKTVGKLACEELIGWNTTTQLAKWAKRERS